MDRASPAGPGLPTLTVNGKPAVGSLEDGFVYLVVNAGYVEMRSSSTCPSFVRANPRASTPARWPLCAVRWSTARTGR
ncbi:MAG: hypothetical protein ACLS6O_00550 [Bifidobacterium sp.]